MGGLSLEPTHCKNNQLAEHDDIILVQRSLADFELGACRSREELLDALAACINNLVLTDFFRLVQILYRIDINENQLKKALRENEDQDAGKIIAGMIIERELQKLESRRQFRNTHDIPDDEKW